MFKIENEPTVESILMTAYGRVIDWNTAVGKADWTDQAAVHNQMSVVREELLVELAGAHDAKSFVDAICDSFVVVANLFHLVSKGEKYVPKMLTHIKVTDSAFFLTDGMVAGCLRHTDGIQLILDHICNVMVKYRAWDCIGALFDVLDNNDDKFMEKELDVGIETVLTYYNHAGQSVEAVDIGDVVWFRRMSDNKVMKPKPFFEEVDFSNRQVYGV